MATKTKTHKNELIRELVYLSSLRGEGETGVEFASNDERLGALKPYGVRLHGDRWSLLFWTAKKSDKLICALKRTYKSWSKSFTKWNTIADYLKDNRMLDKDGEIPQWINTLMGAIEIHNKTATDDRLMPQRILDAEMTNAQRLKVKRDAEKLALAKEAEQTTTSKEEEISMLLESVADLNKRISALSSTGKTPLPDVEKVASSSKKKKKKALPEIFEIP